MAIPKEVRAVLVDELARGLDQYGESLVRKSSTALCPMLGINLAEFNICLMLAKVLQGSLTDVASV